METKKSEIGKIWNNKMSQYNACQYDNEIWHEILKNLRQELRFKSKSIILKQRKSKSKNQKKGYFIKS